MDDTYHHILHRDEIEMIDWIELNCHPSWKRKHYGLHLKVFQFAKGNLSK